MIRYKNLSGDSGVIAYEIGKDFIKVKFNGGAGYLYTYDSAGVDHIEKMKSLAASGKGLSTFISTYVKNQYASQF